MVDLSIVFCKRLPEGKPPFSIIFHHFSIIFHHFPSFSIIFPSFSIIFHHFPSFFHHFPSFSIIFHHFPSFSIIFHHFPSFSIIFHHFPMVYKPTYNLRVPACVKVNPSMALIFFCVNESTNSHRPCEAWDNRTV